MITDVLQLWNSVLKLLFLLTLELHLLGLQMAREAKLICFTLEQVNSSYTLESHLLPYPMQLRMHSSEF